MTLWKFSSVMLETSDSNSSVPQLRKIFSVGKYISRFAWRKCAFYFRSRTMEAGFSRYDFHRLEKRHMVAPSMIRWSADQLTFMMCAFTTSPLWLNRGSTCGECKKDNVTKNWAPFSNLVCCLGASVGSILTEINLISDWFAKFYAGSKSVGHKNYTVRNRFQLSLALACCKANCTIP